MEEMPLVVQVWTVMFNAICPANLAAPGSYAYWEGALCSGTEVQPADWAENLVLSMGFG